MLKRAVDAKEATERAEIEEALKLAYMDYVADDVINMGSSNSRFANAVSKVQSQGYENKLVVKPGESKSYKLSSSNMILANGETATITVEEDNSATSSDSKVYAVIDGNYYEVNEINGDIKIATIPKAPSEVDSGSSSSEITIGEVSSANESVATVAKEGNGVKVTAKSTVGTSKITVTVNGSAKEVNVEVVGSIVDLTNNDGYKLDGAMVPRDTTAGTGKTVSSSDESIAQVTTEGIVKCGTKTGETTVKIDDKAYKIKSTARIIQAGANKTLDGSTTGTANNPIIPTGFSAINTKDAQWKDDDGNNVVASNVNNGLVIMDEKGNQFVWVPVPNAIYDSSKEGDLPISTSEGTKNGKTYTPMVIDVATGATKKGTFDSNGTYKGILYNYGSTAGAYLMYPRATNKQGIWSQFREPDTLSYDGSSYTISTPSGSTETKTNLSGIEDIINSKYKSNSEYANMANFGNTMQKDYKAMIQSVETNGGFYIGRYESSIINNQTRVVAGVASMSGSQSTSFCWYGLYARQKNFAVDNGLISVESDMVWGSQYDAMMNWMQGTGIDVTATAGSNGTARNADSSRKTGIVAGDKLNNVFDIFGLRYERTAEAYNTDNRGSRGGYYDGNLSPSGHHGIHVTNPGDHSSSRPTLYIQ